MTTPEEWTPEARADLLETIAWIAQDDPSAARRVAGRITAGASRIVDMPGRGRSGRVPGTRELVLAPLPYIIVYAVEEHPASPGGLRVVVLRVLHTARRWPPIRD